jgi:hypothetical protein
VTLPSSDWPHLTGAPTEAQVEAVHDLYRRQSVRPTLADMRVELRHQFDKSWLLELVGEREGEPVWYFSEDIEAAPGEELDAATARLARAGYPAPTAWTKVDRGWDGRVG